MPALDTKAPPFSLRRLDGTAWNLTDETAGRPGILFFFETDCPSCRLSVPYFKRLADWLGDSAAVVGISQDPVEPTREIVSRLGMDFSVVLDTDLSVSRLYDPLAVPTLFLVDAEGRIVRQHTGFEKAAFNEWAVVLGGLIGKEAVEIADPFDGVPQNKPGCVSRHREEVTEGEAASALDLYAQDGPPASRIEVSEGQDLFDICVQAGFSDPLPVVPPTMARVERMIEAAGLPPTRVVAQVPPNYGFATVEKVAANAVMAGCRPEMMPVLMSALWAACDERFNLHGVQGTTHIAAPLMIINGPVRRELGFVSGSGVFSNTAHANSSLGRAFQLVLTHIGGARPGEIDMSTLGNPGRFSFCIAENEENSPWEPLHVERGIGPDESAVTMYAAEPPRSVSEHNARDARAVLRTICHTLATVWTLRACGSHEALVVVGLEHAATIARNGLSKQDVREFLFDHTGVPLRLYNNDDGGEGTQATARYEEIVIDGEPCYRKFGRPEAIHLMVAGGDAGKFSAVLGSWAAGPRGSQMVTYPIRRR